MSEATPNLREARRMLGKGIVIAGVGETEQGKLEGRGSFQLLAEVTKITLDDAGGVEDVIHAPHGICGQVFVGHLLYLVTTDAEETTDYWLTRVDPRGDTPLIEDVARIPFAARSLAFDGERFWTNHREQDQIVCFARPE